MSKKIFRNILKCLECGKILESTHVHDYRTCGCPNDTMVDGGRDYLRYGGHDMDKIELLTEYFDDDEEDTFVWGVFNHEIGETVPHKLSDLEDSHVQNIELHLRRRFLPHDDDSVEDVLYRQARHKADLSIIDNHILPELKRRGLPTVEEEIPHSNVPTDTQHG